ncbi:cyclic pyranopterin monophosphate synthase [Ruminiclostridium hungatei]|uniref:Cyclic pyranopterin monophosphate synthase n=1 Tax=Ruminiclostridium hungatei TaxID=48256 RepID=A0A1V4SP35_RUMHU|nr:radical SAM protein [Ruminiclostridium hungatei]OPX45632.1 cyclic pyranopterin monophosphate synthase [Ruminiclostridium hungatei]
MKRYKKAYVEITNICNLKCDFCPETKRHLKYMTIDEFSHIARELKPFTDYIYFHIMGEPLLNPQIGSFISICDENKLKVNITTNGTLMGKHKSILLNSPGLRKVSISLHSYEANRERISLEEYLSETVTFAREASAKGIICEFRLWNAGIRREREAIRSGSGLNDTIINYLQNAFKQAVPQETPTCLTETVLRQNIKLADKVFLHLAQRFEWPDIDSKDRTEGIFCYGLRDQFGILVDGTVVPCCLDSDGNISLGNIFEQPLGEILCSDRARRIYEGFTARIGVEELCRRCGYAGRHKR